LRAVIEREAQARLGATEADAFLTRLDQVSADILEPLSQLYGNDADHLAAQLVGDALAAAAGRPPALRLLDRRREIDPAWFQRSRMIGYVCYADRFAGSLPGVREHLDYLAELGVTYVHLMPLLRPGGAMIRTACRAGYSPPSAGCRRPGARCSRCARVVAQSSCRQKTAAYWPIAGYIRAARRSWP
jgi:hypothetical protein